MENTPDLQSMKMSSVLSAATPARTSEKSCGSSAKSVTHPLMFLDLTMANGSTMAASWEKVTALRGESWTLNTGESPRVAVVCTLSSILRGGSAPKVLFEREGLQRDFDKIRETWKTSPGNIKESTIKHDSVVGHTVIGAFESHSQDARYTPLPKVCSTLNAQYGTGGNNMPLVTELAYTMQLRAGCDGGGKGALIQIEKSATLSTVQTQTLFQPVTSCLTPWDTQGRRCYDENGIFPTLQARENAGGNQQTVLTAKDSQFIVRRLTPQECAMLQGFPADWAADIPHSDSAEYKMWGNGMALPCMLYIMEGLAAELSKEADNGTSS